MSNEPPRTSFSNPAQPGLAGFALTTWPLSMINAGWYTGEAMNMVLAVALTFGGTAQMIAGAMELPRGNTFGANAFISHGAFWWFFALFVLFLHDKVPARCVGWYLFLWGVFRFHRWIASLTVPAFVSATAFHQNRSSSSVNGDHGFPAPGAGSLLSGVDVRDRCHWLEFNGAKFAGTHSEVNFFGGFNGAPAFSQRRDPLLTECGRQRFICAGPGQSAAAGRRRRSWRR